MKKLTAEVARMELANLKALSSHPSHGISIKAELFMQALEIALPVLEQKDGWISCSERMPDEREQVILWDAELDEHTSGHYSDQTGNFYNGGMIIDNEITHWKPAPARPQPTTDTYRQIENDDWIEWGGGKRPVKTGDIFDIRHRNGNEFKRCKIDSACAENWHIDGLGCDIIAYRVIENDGREG